MVENGLPGLEIPHDVDGSRDGDSEESFRFVRGDAKEDPHQESPKVNQRTNSPTFSFADPNETRTRRRESDRLDEGKRGDLLRDLSNKSAQGSTASGATPVSTLRFASSDEDDVVIPQSITPQEGQQRHERRTRRVVGAPPGLPTDADLAGVRHLNESAQDSQKNPAFNIVVEDFDALAKARDEAIEQKQLGLPTNQDSNIWKERYFKLKDEYDALSSAHANVVEQYRRLSAEVSKTSGMPSKTSAYNRSKSNVVDISLQQAKDKISQQNEEIQALLEQRIAVEAELAELRFSSVGRDTANASEPHSYNELKKALHIKDKTIEALKTKLKQDGSEDSTTIKKKKKGWFGSSSSSKKSDLQKPKSALEMGEPQGSIAAVEAQTEKNQRLVELERENAKLLAQLHLLQQDKAQIEERLEALQLQLELLLQKKAVDEAALREAATRAPPPFTIPEGFVAPGPGDNSAPHWEAMFKLQQAATEKLSLKNQQLEDMLNTYAKSTTNLKKKTNTLALREEAPAACSTENVEELRKEVRNLQERVAEKDRQLDVSNTTLVHQKEEMEKRNEATQAEIARLRDKLNSYRTMIGNLLTRQGHIRDRLSDTQKKYLQDVQEYQTEVRALRDGREARCPQATNPPNHRIRAFGSFGVRVAGSRSRQLAEAQNPEASSRTAPAQLQSTYTSDDCQPRIETSKINACTSAQVVQEDKAPITASSNELPSPVEKPMGTEATALEPEARLGSESSIMSHSSCGTNTAENTMAQGGQRLIDANGFRDLLPTLKAQLPAPDMPLSCSSIRPVVMVEVNDPSVSPEANAVRGLDDLAVPMPIVTDADRALALASLKRWVKNGRCTKNTLSYPQSSEQPTISELSQRNKPGNRVRLTTDLSQLKGENGLQPRKPLRLIEENEASSLAAHPNTAARGYPIATNDRTPYYSQDNSRTFFSGTSSRKPLSLKEPIPKIPLPAPVTVQQSFKAQSLTPNPAAFDPTKRQPPRMMPHNASLLPSSGSSLISPPPDTYSSKELEKLESSNVALKSHADIPQNDALPSEGKAAYRNPGLACVPSSVNMSSPEMIQFSQKKTTSQSFASETKTVGSQMPKVEEVCAPTHNLQRVDPAVPSAPLLGLDHERTVHGTYETKLPHASSLTKGTTMGSHFLTKADSDHSSPPRYRIRGGTVEDLIHDLDEEQDTSYMQYRPVARDLINSLKKKTEQEDTTFERPTGRPNNLKRSDSWDELAGNP